MQVELIGAVTEMVPRLRRIGNGQGDTKKVLTKKGEIVEVEIPVPYQAQVNAWGELRELAGLVAGLEPHPDEPEDGEEALPRFETAEEAIEWQRDYHERQRERQGW